VRVRPQNAKELGQETVVEVNGATVTLHESMGDKEDKTGALTASSQPPSFTYDHAFNESVAQAGVFQTLGRDLVRDTMLGFNCSVFAYGQTSSGKSFTMMGDGDGLAPRICKCLLNCLKQQQVGFGPGGGSFSVEASYFEIYNEKVSCVLLHG
jgi:hypothetical protein